MSQSLSHYDAEGRARMVDVSDKTPCARTAIAEAFLCAREETIDRILAGDLPKGEALAVARVAGIQGAKKCSDLIPLCHPLQLTHVEVDFERNEPDRLRIIATTRTIERTGVEMEALCAVTMSALTVWDMVKGIDTELKVCDITLLEKKKGEKP